VDIRDARACDGRLVAYAPAGGGREYGRITGTGEKTVFVLYHGDRRPKGTRPEDLELVTLELHSRPADIAAAWLPAGASLTLRGIAVETPDIEVGYYLAVSGRSLPGAGRLVWRATAQGLRTAMLWSGMAMWEVAARDLARAARESLGPLALYVEHEETLTRPWEGRSCSPEYGWRATRIRRDPTISTAGEARVPAASHVPDGGQS
jgi:hypothetical protein